MLCGLTANLEVTDDANKSASTSTKVVVTARSGSIWTLHARAVPLASRDPREPTSPLEPGINVSKCTPDDTTDPASKSVICPHDSDQGYAADAVHDAVAGPFQDFQWVRSVTYEIRVAELVNPRFLSGGDFYAYNHAHDTGPAFDGLVAAVREHEHGHTIALGEAAGQPDGNANAAIERTISTSEDQLRQQIRHEIVDADRFVATWAADGSGHVHDPAGNWKVWLREQSTWEFVDCRELANKLVCRALGPTVPSAPPSGPVLELSPDHPISLPVDGFAPGEPVHGELHSEVVDLGTRTADPDGVVEFTVLVPTTVPPGPHELVFTGLTSGRVVSIRGFVASRPTLANTGVSVAVPTSVGLAVLFFGTALLAVNRRRRYARH